MHPITGVTILDIGGESRSLSCDMNAAAALGHIVGGNWSEWLVARCMGYEEHGARQVSPMTPEDILIILFSLLSSDRQEHRREGETLNSLGRAIGFAQIADAQVAIVRCVMSGFHVPGEVIEAVVSAMGESRKRVAARGTGRKHSS